MVSCVINRLPNLTQQATTYRLQRELRRSGLAGQKGFRGSIGKRLNPLRPNFAIC